ncbi:MAG: T9SS type A sorting domain-containing protein [Ignavibacterium sp.]|jgi:hypothetical protein|uniref:T9SS type A sorting domain-containing protein n=1 Tax=Ignavibacterium sp. TaxID=2651167 RepID=UPI0032989934
MVDGIAIDKSALGYSETVTEYKLEQNYPNPFNPTTRIKYSIKERQLVQLKIFDVLGRDLFTLEDNYKEPGNYETEFDASSLASGVYIYRLSAGDFVDVKKMVVVK